MQLIILKLKQNKKLLRQHKRSNGWHIHFLHRKLINFDFSFQISSFFWLHILDLFDCNGESSRSAFEEVPLDRLDANRLPTFALRTLAPVSPCTNSSSTSLWCKKK